jgi:YfiH family protein
MSALPLITPEWAAPPHIGAAMSTRLGGVSAGAYASLNLRPIGLDAPGVAGDDPEALAENLRRYEAAIGVRPVFLRQVHGPVVVNLDEALPALPTADAAVTTRVEVACTVMVADCLPVLFTDEEGRAVAAAHSGWRGLAAGVLEATVEALCRAAACEPAQVRAWLGPCIGPEAFEVGADVRKAFAHAGAERFRPVLPQAYCPAAHDGNGKRSARPSEDMSTIRHNDPRKWFADLAGLAQDRLYRLGVGSITPCQLSTVSDPSRFFSFRRDGLTGRMAASIWRRG